MKTTMKRRWRKIGCFFLMLAMLTVGIGSMIAYADGFPNDAVKTPILLDGKEILAGECIRTGGVTYVPFRSFCETFGNGNISWNGKTNTAIYQSDILTLKATVGTLYITDNGHFDYTVETVRNFGGKVYVPIRPMAKAFALNLQWDSVHNCVNLTPVGTKRAISWANYDADAVYWLSRIISAEAGGESMKGKIAVGNVVLNRVASREYPNSIYGVIFDRQYGIQFSPVANGSIYGSPNTESIIAAKICLEGYSLSDTVLFFVNPRIATSSWIQKNRSYAFTIGNHVFFN